MRPHWTHITLPASKLDGTIDFFTRVCGLALVRDRRAEGGANVWLGPPPAAGGQPEFVVVFRQGEVIEPFNHFGFQCATRAEVTAIADQARRDGTLVTGPIDAGGCVGYLVIVREPSGHLVEFTHGQPLEGLHDHCPE